MSTSPVVIAEDIGFGHTKYSVGRNARNRILVERYLVRAIDENLASEQPLMLYGAQFDYASFMRYGLQVAHDAAQAIHNAIGIDHEIDMIVITGGGGPLYEEAIKKALPRHPVVLLEQPAYANVRGFHILGEQIARSMSLAREM